MHKFVKLFETLEYGQILIESETNSEGEPQVRVVIYFEEIGKIEITPTFKSTEEGYKDRDRLFESIDKLGAIKYGDTIRDQIIT